MIKICFVTTIYGTYRAFLKNFTIFLHESGEYDVSLICNNEEGVIEDIPQFVHYYPVAMERGISISAINAIKSIGKIIGKNNFDIVQYTTPNAAFYTSIAARRKKVPVRLYCLWGIRYMGFEGWKKSLFKFLEKTTCNNSTYIEVESNNIREFSLEEGLFEESKSCVIWNGSASGVDLGKFNILQKEDWKRNIRRKYELNEDDIVFVFVGRLTADKGVNELLEAFLNIEKSYMNVKLFILGGMDHEASIESKLLENAKKSKNVIFTGNVDTVEQYYAASDVFVAPSYREGFGLVVIEAEAMGIPAVVSNVPGQIDAIVPNETGLLCTVKDADDLRLQMETMIINEELRLKLGENAAKYVKENYEQKQLFVYLKQHRDHLVKAGEN